MANPARPFGLSTGGFDRRNRSDRRSEDRRKDTVPVAVDRRAGEERRSRRGRRITEWFPVKPVHTPLRLVVDSESPETTPEENQQPDNEGAARSGDEMSGRRKLRLTEHYRVAKEFYTQHSFVHNQRQYDIESEDLTDRRGRLIGRQWLIKAEGVVEHTLRVLPNEDRDALEQRAVQAIESTSVGAARELDFTFRGRRYHLEDWSDSVSQRASNDLAMWCVTCDGVIEATFAAPRGEAESVLHHRAVDIARRSDAFRVIPGEPTKPVRKSLPNPKPQPPRPVASKDEPAEGGSLMVLVWIALGLFAASAVSTVVQTTLLGGP